MNSLSKKNCSAIVGASGIMKGIALSRAGLIVAIIERVVATLRSGAVLQGQAVPKLTSLHMKFH